MVEFFRRDDRKMADKLVHIDGMPADAVIRGANYDAEHDLVEFVIESASFAEVRPGYESERFVLTAGYSIRPEYRSTDEPILTSYCGVVMKGH